MGPRACVSTQEKARVLSVPHVGAALAKGAVDTDVHGRSVGSVDGGLVHPFRPSSLTVSVCSWPLGQAALGTLWA